MKNQNKAWVSAEDLTDNPELRQLEQQEFFDNPALQEMAREEGTERALKSNRRDFLKYLGFGLGAATIAAACETPIRRAIPYVVKPDAIVPGVANYYASTYLNAGDWVPVLVKTREGRPIKIEGNRSCSITNGGTSARAQASVLDLYDTARLRYPGQVKENAEVEEMSWNDIDEAIGSSLSAQSNIRILQNTNISPSAQAAVKRFKEKYPNTEVVTYDPISSSALLAANEASFGKSCVPGYDFSSAKVILTFGADFLGTWISPVEFANQFAKNRKVRDIENAKMNRLVAVESMMSLTGSNADHRVLIKPSEMGLAIATVHNAIAEKMGGSRVSVSGSFANAKAESSLKLVAKDLMEAAQSDEGSLVVSNSNNTAEQILVNSINNMLGNYGKTIDLNNHSLQRQGKDQDVVKLLEDIKAGNVNALFVVGNTNPAYDLPEADQFVENIKKVGLKVSLSGMPNETMALCDYVCPTHHSLESWGDAQPKSNVYSLIQPTIAPLFKTRQYEESFLTWADALPEVEEEGDAVYYTFLRSYWKDNVYNKQSNYNTFRAFWDNTLHDGIIHLDPASGNSPSFNYDVSGLGNAVTKVSSSDLEVSFYEKVGAGAGELANNPWLQEMPDPVTRVVWDNYVCIPLEWDGKKRFNYFNNLKEDGLLVDVESKGITSRLPIVRQFGMVQSALAIALGYGRELSGKAGTGVGKNVFPYLNRDADGNTQYFSTDIAVSDKVGKDKIFASVQHHHTMGVKGTDASGETINVDEKALMSLGSGYQGSLTDRTVLRSANIYDLEDRVSDLKYERKHHQKLNDGGLYPGHDDQFEMGHHWGMAVDLSSCIGCGACQVACVAENNVPIVGKEEVHRHHEMTWMRIDRYYYGDAESPNVVYQPMMCQHCDNAPCENVCPVSATNHSSEGLNQMAYNRCVGTRYCANNCPYKVRRFNWLDYTTADLFPVNENDPFNEDVPFYADNLTRMVLNPDVTVRSRGVIEKCSFCVQRIQEGKLKAKSEGRRLKDGDVKSACQTACPTGAIVFGDMNDKDSELNKLLNLPTTYYALEETNVRPSVGYQMKVTNRNKDIETLEA